MSDIMSGMAAAVDNILDTVKLGYSIYQDQRDTAFRNKTFDYQKALQKQIFEREDNAVQRRRADLEAAGLNPNLAAGSAAGAGSVVATSGASAGRQLQGGTDLLNAVVAYRQAQAQKTENEILKTERDIAAERKRQIQRANVFQQVENIFRSGAPAYNYYISPYGNNLANNNGDIYYVEVIDGKHYIKGQDENGDPVLYPRLNESKIWVLLQNGYDISNNDAYMSTYDRENYSMDRWIDRVSEGVGAVSDVVGSVTGGIKDLSPESKIESETYTRNKNGYTRQRRSLRK